MECLSESLHSNDEGLSAFYDFKNLLLVSAYSLQIIEIPPFVMLSTNLYFSVSKISFKLTPIARSR